MSEYWVIVDLQIQVKSQPTAISSHSRNSFIEDVRENGSNLGTYRSYFALHFVVSWNIDGKNTNFVKGLEKMFFHVDKKK